jgi:radical SAM superfamily enzyme YgiQ (UPF0313 family)
MTQPNPPTFFHGAVLVRCSRQKGAPELAYAGLVEVYVHQIDGVSTMRALPLAAGLLVASARRSLAARASLHIHTERGDPDALAAAYRSPDVLAFSCYVWNERYSLELARRARARWPGALIVFGGPSVPRQPDRAALFLREHPFVDLLVLGEGEVAFREILCALDEGRPLDGIAGLALRERAHSQGARLTTPRARMADFGDTASPYLDGTFDQLLELRGSGAAGAAILETNRGCPFACTFCDWGQAIASRVYELPIERIHGELDWIARRRIPYLYIVDANYGIRRRDIEIIHELGRLKAQTGYPQYVFFHLTKNATERHLGVVLALREAGIATHLALSAQDFEPRVLLAVKRDNIRLENALELRRICHERGIPTFNELILGLPEQTYDSFADGMIKAITPYPGDAFNLYLARVLENAEMATAEQRACYGIETRRVLIASFHRDAAVEHVPEMEEVVVATRAMPVSDWRRAYKLGYFLAAAHNLRLLDVVLQVAWRAARLDLRAFVEAMLARASAASEASALGAIDRVLERHATAVLDGEAMVLAAHETGSHLWAVEDSILVAALGRREGFFAEIEALVREELGDTDAGALVGEAVRFQRLVTPAPGEHGERCDSFPYDFPAWRLLAADAEVPRRATRIAWSPALPRVPDLRSFVLSYLGAIHARLATGNIRYAPA